MVFSFLILDFSPLQNNELQNNHQESDITSGVVEFSDYGNTIKDLVIFEPKDNYGQHPMINEMYQRFPDWAGYYTPTSTVHDVQNVDIDNDGIDEHVIYYSCLGCNAPARNIDIVKDNKIIFTVEGGNLRLENVENEDGFHIFTTMIPRGTGDIKVTFEKTTYGEYHPVEEEEIYINN
jgi:hypothetical protein